MSKTYRDVVKGRYRYDEKLFDNDPNNKAIYWLKCISWKQDNLGQWIYAEDGRHVREERWYKTKRIKIELSQKTPWHQLKWEDKQYIELNYTKNPSWHNKLFNRVPKRRNDRDLLSKYKSTKIIDAECDHEFSLNNKPDNFYW